MSAFLESAKKMGADNISQRVSLLQKAVHTSLAQTNGFDGGNFSEYVCFHICGCDYLVFPNEEKAQGIRKIFLGKYSLLAINMNGSTRTRVSGCLEDSSGKAMRKALDIAAQGAWSGQGNDFFMEMKKCGGQECKLNEFVKERTRLNGIISPYWDDPTRLGLGAKVSIPSFNMSSNPLFTGQVQTRRRAVGVF